MRRRDFLCAAAASAAVGGFSVSYGDENTVVNVPTGPIYAGRKGEPLEAEGKRWGDAAVEHCTTYVSAAASTRSTRMSIRSRGRNRWFP